MFSLAGDKAQGALKRSTSQCNLAGYTGSGAGYGDIVINATDSNALYKGASFQPKALRGLGIVKI